MGAMGCDHRGECTLAVELKKRRTDLEKIRKVLETAPKKSENERRLKILKQFLKPKGHFVLEDKHCRGLGDVMFAIFCPDDSHILTTNVADHGPLAATLGKQ